MVYTSTYRHTIVVDLLEYLGIVSNLETLRSAREDETRKPENTDKKECKPDYDIECGPNRSCSESSTDSDSSGSQIEKMILSGWIGTAPVILRTHKTGPY